MMEIEWENRVLRAQLQLTELNNNNSQSTPVRFRPRVDESRNGRESFRQSMGSDPTIQLSGLMCHSESLTSVTSQNFNVRLGLGVVELIQGGSKVPSIQN